MHKTGSTSIQNSLASLDDKNFYYARILGAANHSVAMFSAFAEAPESKHLRKLELRKKMTADEIVAEAKRDLKASIAAAGQRTLLISGEGMLRLTEADLQRLRKFLERQGYGEIEVFAYVRPPGGYLTSAVQQRIRAGGFANFAIHRSLPDYRNKFEKFDRVFGESNVKLAKFDPAQFKNGDVVEDFCARIGIPVGSVEIVRKNESISRLAAFLAYQYHHHHAAENLPPLRARQSLRLAELLAPFDKTKFKLAQEVLSPIIAGIRPDIEWIEGRLNESLHEDLSAIGETGLTSEAELLQPIEGINAKLEALLADAGLSSAAKQQSTWSLIANLIWPLKTQRRRASQRADALEEAKARRKADKNRRVRGAAGGSDDGGAGVARRLRRAQREGRISADGEATDRRRGSGGVARLRQDRREARSERGRGPGQGKAGKGPSTGQKLGAGKGTAGGKAQAGILKIPQVPDDHPMAVLNRPKPNHLLVTISPRPMLNATKNLIVYWSPKSACTTVYVWFSHLSGFLPQVRDYAKWPHRHRQDIYDRSRLYHESIEADLAGSHAIRIMRDPYSRAVSIYRHALQTRFADAPLSGYLNGARSFEAGISFLDFLDFVATLDMSKVDMHFRPQYHPFEREKPAARVINVSRTDLFEGLNAFERDTGMPLTDFKSFGWLHDLEQKRKAQTSEVQGESLDRMAFTRHQVEKLGIFPNYSQLLTEEARRKIELIYKSDFDAYRNYL
jgi:hypothetical protein